MIVLIDNYDSFTFNLVQYLADLGAEVAVHRNDKISADDVIAANPDAIVLSPGPCTPNEAGICLDLIGKAAETIPILGVCLGHQAIAQAFGGKVVRAPVPMHGKLSEIRHTGSGVFRGINNSFKATRYHSLVVERTGMPSVLIANAETDDGVVMGLMHQDLPLHGVQFHPESIASEHGHLMLQNFLDIAAAWNVQRGRQPMAAVEGTECSPPPKPVEDGRKRPDGGEGLGVGVKAKSNATTLSITPLPNPPPQRGEGTRQRPPRRFKSI